MVEAIIIQGPTASGKTELAIAVADYFKTEVVSFDSRQFYREMSIGTAKPSLEERSKIRHHFIDSSSLTEPINVSEYANLALPVITKIINEFGRVVLCGGSNQFVDALTFGFDPVPVFHEIRLDLDQLYIKKGLEYLQDWLKKIDPNASSVLDMQNPRRVIRALEVYLGSGQSISSIQTSPRIPNFTYKRFGIHLDRALLYQRINSRVDLMINEGLEEEVMELQSFWKSNLFRTVGYQEWLSYFEGKSTRLEVVEKIKQNSRNYAKRQLTWLKKYQDIHWISEEGKQERLNQIIQEVG